jgi:hypothetical protein
MTVWRDVERQVAVRAHGRCEYCRMHQSLQGATFHVEHVLPRSRGGDSSLNNLAWACPGSNLRKSNRIEVRDPDSEEWVPLFNPRIHDWTEHFDWHGHEVIGLTPIGRSAVAALGLNEPRRIRIREAEELFGLFLPAQH